MKKAFSLIFLFLTMIGCQKEPLMTRQAFSQIEPGMSIKEVEKLYGKPYTIYSRDADSEIYEYIERMLLGPDTVTQYRYYLIVSNGKVIGKYSKYSTPPAFQQIYSDDPYPNY